MPADPSKASRGHRLRRTDWVERVE